MPVTIYGTDITITGNGTVGNYIISNNNFYITTAVTLTLTTPIYSGWVTNAQNYVNNWYKPPAPLTEEQIAARQKELDLQNRKQALAKCRARNLLKENLSSEQWNMFEKCQYFEIISQTGEVYRIRLGRSRNVTHMKDGKEFEILCAHPNIQCPNEDTMLAQKLMLETNEEAFRKIANIDRVHRPAIYAPNLIGVAA